MTCAVSIDIDAPPERIWELLTNAADFPRWNSTVTRITGKIDAGEKLALEVPAAPGRTFKPKVTELEPARRMVWSDGMAPMFKGVRTFTLDPQRGRHHDVHDGRGLQRRHAADDQGLASPISPPASRRMRPI